MKKINTILLFSISYIITLGESTINFSNVNSLKLKYECWGTIYHPVKWQCDDTPLITGNGFKIDPNNASNHRVIAISQNMLNDVYRLSLLNDTINDNRFRGKLNYGDSVYVLSPIDSFGNYIYPNINGWWHIEDTKNPRFENSIDFLQTEGDRSLYNYDMTWNGKFENIKIYKYYGV